MGTRNPDHVASGIQKSGMMVVIMWMKSSGMATRSAPRMRNKIPMRHSKRPNSTMNVPKPMSIGMVAL